MTSRGRERWGGGGGRGRGLKRDRDGESYGERSEKEWHSVEKWIDEEQID